MTQMDQTTSTPPEELKPIPKPYKKSGRVNWLEAKKLYITDPTWTYKKLAEKYGVDQNYFADKASKKGFLPARKDMQLRANDKLMELAPQKLAEIQLKHLSLGSYLQSIGEEDLIAGRQQFPLSPKMALESIALGNKIERKAAGLESSDGVKIQVNNIMAKYDE